MLFYYHNTVIIYLYLKVSWVSTYWQDQKGTIRSLESSLREVPNVEKLQQQLSAKDTEIEQLTVSTY